MNDQARSTPTHDTYSVQKWVGDRSTETTDRAAEEVPLSLVYNGMPHVVMMATPADLEDFALGFSLSEGVLSNREELLSIVIAPVADGVSLRMEIDFLRYLPLEEQHRNLAGRTGCGLCGAETIEQAVRHPAPVGEGVRIGANVLERALSQLSSKQTLNALTGAVHAAAWVTTQGDLVAVREDVGRHNALDKMIGAVVREDGRLIDGFAIITSRASFEMVQKAATLGISVLAAISAPTGLAIRLAQETGMTLVGFARAGQFNVYTNSHRIEPR